MKNIFQIAIGDLKLFAINPLLLGLENSVTSIGK